MTKTENTGQVTLANGSRARLLQMPPTRMDVTPMGNERYSLAFTVTIPDGYVPVSVNWEYEPSTLTVTTRPQDGTVSWASSKPVASKSSGIVTSFLKGLMRHLATWRCWAARRAR